jgi:ribosomal protein L12E/L44/L45/RPP1/RPP2
LFRLGICCSAQDGPINLESDTELAKGDKVLISNLTSGAGKLFENSTGTLRTLREDGRWLVELDDPPVDFESKCIALKTENLKQIVETLSKKPAAAALKRPAAATAPASKVADAPWDHQNYKELKKQFMDKAMSEDDFMAMCLVSTLPHNG